MKMDLVLAGAAIVDGNGGPPFDGWIGVEGSRIAAVGREADAPPAARRIDVAGSTVTPGFVDVHNHSDLSALILPTMPSTVRQGVTTVVVGNCGSSPWPLSSFEEGVQLAYADPGTLERPAWSGYADYLDAIDAARPAVNIATLVGHGSIRREVMDLERRPPSPHELGAMRSLTATAVEAGAYGVSTGLVYVPGMFAATDELVAVATEAARLGGIYASHIRGEGEHLFRAVDEAIQIGRRASIPAHISHLKCESSLVWGRAGELLERIHRGDDVTGDQYPYTAWNSSLASLLPPWAPVGEIPAMTARPDGRRRLIVAVEDGEPNFQSSVKGVGWDRIVIVGAADERWDGLDVETIARLMDLVPFDAFVRLLQEDPDTSCIGHAMREDDVATIAGDPGVFVASDASATAPDGPGGTLPVHPREYGTFPRFLARHVRERRAMSFEAAIRKMTSLPADRFDLRDRGRIREGSFADLVVIDRDSITDTATFERPHSYPIGIEMVIVNGRVAWETNGDGDGTAASRERAGRVLRRS